MIMETAMAADTADTQMRSHVLARYTYIRTCTSSWRTVLVGHITFAPHSSFHRCHSGCPDPLPPQLSHLTSYKGYKLSRLHYFARVCLNGDIFYIQTNNLSLDTIDVFPECADLGRAYLCSPYTWGLQHSPFASFFVF